LALPAGFHENAAMDNTPAENQLGKITGSHVVSVFEDRDGMNPGLLFNTMLKLLHHMLAQLPINNELPHLVAIM
jgi:hypothetical protein